jgi:TolB-like protein
VAALPAHRQLDSNDADCRADLRISARAERTRVYDGSLNALAATLYYLGDFEDARQYAMRGVQVWCLGSLQSPTEEVDAPRVTCLYFRALSEWHVGEIAAAKSSMAEAVSLAKELNNMHALVLAQYHAAVLGVYERNPLEVERYASDLIELSTRQNFASHLCGAEIVRGWAQSVNTVKGIARIEDGIRDFRATGAILGLPFFLALKAEALHAAHRISEALEAIKEAEALVERSQQRNWCAELYRLRGVFLAATGASEAQIEASFSAAIRTAREQRSISLATRAEASYAEYRRQRGAGSDPLTISLPAAKGLERSIAVLPFESLSDNRNDAYFADGIQDEILSNLAKASQLKVISRTSVMTYRPGANRDLRSIADALGVANVVEGTVRRDGNRIRLTSKLIDARTDEIVWSETYDRDLTDIFAIQSEIAQTVASRLSAQLSLEERKGIEEKPTNNLEAYDLYLRAKQLLGPNTVVIILWRIEKETFSRAITLLEEATQKDRNFALAYCMIAKAHDYLYSDQVDRTPERRALGDAAVNEALRLRPDLAEVHLAAAFHFYTCYRDFERARVQIAIAAQALPNNSDLLQLTAFIDRVQGRWEKATASLDRAATLNPRNPELLFTLADTYRCRRRYRDNERILDRLIELEPDQPLFPLEKARSAFAEKADLNRIRAAHETLPTSMKVDVYITWERVYYAMCARDFAAAGEIVSKSPNEEIRFFGPLVPRRIVALWLELVQGNHPAIEEFGAAREQLYRKVEADRTDPFMLAALALTDVALGRKEESIQEARRAMEMRPISEDAEDGPVIAANVAVVYAWANQSDFAFEQLNILIKRTSYFLVTYGNLKTNPSWDPLRKDPRFDRLLAELAPKD